MPLLYPLHLFGHNSNTARPWKPTYLISLSYTKLSKWTGMRFSTLSQCLVYVGPSINADQINTERKILKEHFYLTLTGNCHVQTYTR